MCICASWWRCLKEKVPGGWRHRLLFPRHMSCGWLLMSVLSSPPGPLSGNRALFPLFVFTVICFLTSSSFLLTVLCCCVSLPFFWPRCHHFLGQPSPFFAQTIRPIRPCILFSLPELLPLWPLLLFLLFLLLLKVLFGKWILVERCFFKVNKDFNLTKLLCRLALSVPTYVIDIHFPKMWSRTI